VRSRRSEFLAQNGDFSQFAIPAEYNDFPALKSLRVNGSWPPGTAKDEIPATLAGLALLARFREPRQVSRFVIRPPSGRSPDRTRGVDKEFWQIVVVDHQLGIHLSRALDGVRDVLPLKCA
jgi:hypothetical protein